MYIIRNLSNSKFVPVFLRCIEMNPLATVTCRSLTVYTASQQKTVESFVVSNQKKTSKSGIFNKIKQKLKFVDMDQYRLKVKGLLLYEKIVDNIDHDVFFKEFQLPDTFLSWFLVIELHIWMILLRCMADQYSGPVIRHELIEAMWKDVDIRIKKLGPIPASTKKSEISILAQQFGASLIGYDEGVMCDDKVLAGAIWRRFFHCECNNPEHVEKLVVYIRKQVHLLEKISIIDLLNCEKIKWVDIKSC